MGVLWHWPQGGIPGLGAIVQHTGPEGQDSDSGSPMVREGSRVLCDFVHWVISIG